MIKFVILVNKLGQTRLARYFEEYEMKDRVPMEADIVRKCLARGENQVDLSLRFARRPF